MERECAVATNNTRSKEDPTRHGIVQWTRRGDAGSGAGGMGAQGVLASARMKRLVARVVRTFAALSEHGPPMFALIRSLSRGSSACIALPRLVRALQHG